MHPGKKSYADQTFFLFRAVCKNRTICRQLVLRTALLPSLPPSAFYSYAVLIAVLHPRPLSHADQDFLFHPANLHLADTEFFGDLGLRLILVVAQPDQDFFLFGKLVYKLFYCEVIAGGEHFATSRFFSASSQVLSADRAAS